MNRRKGFNHDKSLSRYRNRSMKNSRYKNKNTAIVGKNIASIAAGVGSRHLIGYIN